MEIIHVEDPQGSGAGRREVRGEEKDDEGYEEDNCRDLRSFIVSVLP
jgi:hypothetical protein